MIVYREPDATTDPRVLLADCRAQARALALAGRPDHDAVTGLLIDLGVLEAAVADALFPVADDVSPPAEALRGMSLAGGRLFRASWRAEAAPVLRSAARDLAVGLDRLTTESWPALVRPKVPEGYAYYALYPETYLAAAERYVRDVRPGRAVVVGVRSIGTSLAAVVAAAVEAAGVPVAGVTLRPRGHPFDRRPVLTPGLAAELGRRADTSYFLVVDEGPGLSASSLTGTAALLADLSVTDDRIALFPSHLPDPAGFVAPAARERWARHRKALAPFETAFPSGPLRGAAAQDLGGGAWRAVTYADERLWPAAHPWWERRKYLAEPEGGGAPVLHKFAGLGRYGGEALTRATTLAAAGFSPPVLGLKRGFLRHAWLAARPLTRHDGGSPAFLRTAVAYLGHLAGSYATGGAARPGPLLDLLRANVAEGLGPAQTSRLVGLERHLAGFGEVPAVALDGHMSPHEWLLTPSGRFAKADAVDHHADHFFPGPADAAWDVAGLAAEFALPDGTAADLAAAVAGVTGDRGLPSRLPFHAATYLAFRLGQTTIAADTLRGTADGERMRRSARRYRWQLRRALDRLTAVAGT